MHPFLQGHKGLCQSNKTFIKIIKRINMSCFIILLWPIVKVSSNLCVIIVLKYLFYESCKGQKKETFYHKLIYIQMVLAYQKLYSRTKHQGH